MACFLGRKTIYVLFGNCADYSPFASSYPFFALLILLFATGDQPLCTASLRLTCQVISSWVGQQKTPACNQGLQHHLSVSSCASPGLQLLLMLIFLCLSNSHWASISLYFSCPFYSRGIHCPLLLLASGCLTIPIHPLTHLDL